MNSKLLIFVISTLGGAAVALAAVFLLMDRGDKADQDEDSSRHIRRDEDRPVRPPRTRLTLEGGEVTESESLPFGPGVWTIGSGRRGEPRRQVELTYRVQLDSTEMTQREFQSLMGVNPSEHRGCDDCPVESINWYEAIAAANARSRREGLDECYMLEACQGELGSGCSSRVCERGGLSCHDVNFEGLSCLGYRLPTEAEWEIGAESNTSTLWHFGSADDGLPFAAMEDNVSSSMPVGRFKRNLFGLYDTAGNVWEWTYDGYRESVPQEERNPIGGWGGDRRVDRGGMFTSSMDELRHSRRSGTPPNRRGWDVGVRLARTLEWSEEPAPTVLIPSAVTASSTGEWMRPGERVPAKAIDGDMTTWWMEGADDDGIGEWIELEFNSPSSISRVGFLPGYGQFDMDHHMRPSGWVGNNRVTAVRLQVDGRDIGGVQMTDNFQWRDIEIEPPVRGSRVRLVIEEIAHTDFDTVARNRTSGFSEIKVWAAAEQR